MVVEVKIHGLQDYKAALMGLPAKLRKRALRNALAAGARIVRDEAKRLAPVLKGPARYRTAGTLRNAIRVRTSKQARQQGIVGVFVNVKPAKKGQRGAKSKSDPFYWRWLEFGRSARAAGAKRRRLVRGRKPLRAVGAIAPMRFLQGAAGKLQQALEKFKAVIGPQIQKLNAAPKDPL